MPRSKWQVILALISSLPQRPAVTDTPVNPAAADRVTMRGRPLPAPLLMECVQIKAPGGRPQSPEIGLRGENLISPTPGLVLFLIFPRSISPDKAVVATHTCLQLRLGAGHVLVTKRLPSVTLAFGSRVRAAPTCGECHFPTEIKNGSVTTGLPTRLHRPGHAAARAGLSHSRACPRIPAPLAGDTEGSLVEQKEPWPWGSD